MTISGRLAALVAVLIVLAGCATNPVTGRTELALVPESWELQTGIEQYDPVRQSQGGDYVLDPALTDYVQEVGQRLAAVSDRDLPYEFSIINSSVPNAWALPGGKIAVNRGLLVEFESEAELAAVLGHEIVHAAARHSAQQMQRGMMLQGAVLATGVALSDSRYGNLAVGSAAVAAGLVGQRYSREAEREADYYGMIYMSRAGYDPAAAITLQETFVRLSEGRRSDWLSGMFASHPPSQERVEANRRTAASLPPGGEVGRERYQRMIAGLLETKEAFEANDRAREALRAGRSAEALNLVDRAIAGEPREAFFHATRGDILRSQNRNREAVAHYDRAVSLNDGFFYYHLQRGLTLQAMGERNAARRDLETSQRLLPTAAASRALGGLALDAGDRNAAREYFRQAAGTTGADGREAAEALVRLDLADNPGDYLRLRTGTDGRGMILVEVGNATPLAVNDIVLAWRYRDPQGRIREGTTRVPGTLRSGATAQVAPGLGPVADPRRIDDAFRVAVARARVAE